MAIGTGAQLATAITNWTARADLASRIPEFVLLAEANLFSLLRTPDMETKDAAFSITGEYVAVPTGFLEARTFYHNTTDQQAITFQPPDVQTSYLVSGTGVPVYFSVIGSNFRFAPVPDATYSATLVYYKAPTTVSTGSTETNWLLTARPDVYLYAALKEAWMYLSEDQRKRVDEEYPVRVASLVRAGNRMRWGGSGMAARPG